MKTWPSEFLEAQSAVFKLLLLSNQQSETQRLYLLSEMTKEKTNAHTDEAATSSFENKMISVGGRRRVCHMLDFWTLFLFSYICVHKENLSVFLSRCRESEFGGQSSKVAFLHMIIPPLMLLQGAFGESIHPQLFCSAHIELQVIDVAPCDQRVLVVPPSIPNSATFLLAVSLSKMVAAFLVTVTTATSSESSHHLCFYQAGRRAGMTSVWTNWIPPAEASPLINRSRHLRRNYSQSRAPSLSLSLSLHSGEKTSP